jgi:DNA-binding transcriptional LysR family regulator
MSIAKAASLRQLATFHAVARLGSVSLAADELHLSQSAVSIQIASLEASAGAPLVLRTGRGLRLTEAGNVLHGYAERLLALWAEASDEMATFLGDFSGTLRIGAVSSAEYWLPRVLVSFVNQNPKVKIKLHVANRDEIVRSLAGQEIDIAVMGQPPGELKVVSAAFARNPVAFLAAPHHPLMRQPHLKMASMAEVPLLVRERGSGSRTTAERLYREAGIRMLVGAELSSNEAIKQMCAAGFGAAYLSLHTCMLELKAGLLKVVPMANNPVERQWFVVRVAAKPVPQVTIAFEQFLRDVGQREIDELLPPTELANPGPALAR